MSAFFLTLLLCLLPQASQSTANHPRELRLPPLRPFVAPEPVHLRLESGAELLVISSEELPLVDGVLLFRGGQSEEAHDQAGLTQLLAEVLRAGGSQRTSGSELDDWLDANAASITVRSTEEALRIEFSCVKDDLGTVLIFIGELIMMPAYPQAELDNSRTRLLSHLSRESDDPALLADQWLDRLSFAQDSPRSRRANPSSLTSLTRGDLLGHHARLFGADRLIVGATGAVRPNSLAARLDSLLNQLPNVGPAPEHESSVFQLPGRRTIYLYDRPDLQHCEVRIAGPGTRRLNRDHAPLSLWSHATGLGGSSTRFMIRLRTELGLIFDGYLYFQPGWKHSGRMLGACSTRSENVPEVLAACFELLRQTEQPSEQASLEAVRQRVLNAGVFEIDSPEEVLERALALLLYDYPADYWTQHDTRLRTLSAKQVAEAATNHLELSRLTILVVGPADQYEEALKALGSVIRVGPE